MMSAIDFVYEINEKVRRYVNNLTEVKAEELGLDRRAGYTLWVDEDHTCIVVPKNRDGSLQYYGGFEYIDKEFRHEIGDYVFYQRDDDRVESCFCTLEGKPHPDDEE
ncbi:hypothetical protein UFOVP787_82 [uncultured Caudovirales phage]|uniref:Uncharacterized protein n=1 Tax=uncultured Caudovirales phage TaxID=2100421 RepID=A0A6J5NY72_9CAUD|nr:hypothetical protein UFOVP787_82 [uncultured Caudovirales phage]